MKQYNIVIYNFSKELLNDNFQFDNEAEARNFTLGILKGIETAGQTATGSKITQVN